MDKPAGLLSMGNEKERTRTAYRMVSDYVKAREPGGRIFIVHRWTGIPPECWSLPKMNG